MGYKGGVGGASTWADLDGKPTSSPNDIDTAVTQKHVHANQTALDNVTGTNTGDQDLSSYMQSKQQVVTVAKSGGDYTTITAALAAITDAASNKRYVILVAPGEYSEAITMKQYVDIVGLGREHCVLTSSTITVISANDSKIKGFEITTTSNGWSAFPIHLANTTQTFVIEDCYVHKTSTNQTCICIGNNSGTTTPLIIKRCRVSGTINSAGSDGGQCLYRIGDLWAEDCDFYYEGSDSTVDIVQVRAGTQYLKNCYIEFISGTGGARCLYKDTSGICYLLNVVLFNDTGGGNEIYCAAGTEVNVTGGGKISLEGDFAGGTITYN